MAIPAAMIPMATAAIQGGSGLFGSIINAVGSARVQGAQNAWNKRMYREQLQDNRQNWAMENAYNSPAAQMARFKEAGLNPHLIYGQGDSGNAGSVPAASAPSASQINPFDKINLGMATSQAIQSYYDAKLKGIEVERAEMALNKETVDFHEREDAYHALVTWMEDRLEKDDPGNVMFVHKWNDDKPALRKSHWYETYNQLLQQGEIKAEEIKKILAATAFLKSQNTLISHQNDVQANLDQLLGLQFDKMSTGDISRAIVQLLLTIFRGNSAINL